MSDDHRCDVAHCDGTRLGHDLAVEFPEETRTVDEALDRLRAAASRQCTEVMVGALPGQPDELWTCAQREGHPGPHNRYAPRDGCTAWADHCLRCAEHVCTCEQPGGVA